MRSITRCASRRWKPSSALRAKGKLETLPDAKSHMRVLVDGATVVDFDYSDEG